MPEIPFSQVTEKPEMEQGQTIQSQAAINLAGRKYDAQAEAFASVLGDKGIVQTFLKQHAKTKEQTDSYKSDNYLNYELEKEIEERVKEENEKTGRILNPSERHEKIVKPYLETAYGEWAKANDVFVTPSMLKTFQDKKESILFNSLADSQDFVTAENIEEGSTLASNGLDFDPTKLESKGDSGLPIQYETAFETIYKITELNSQEAKEEVNKIFTEKIKMEMGNAENVERIDLLLEEAKKLHETETTMPDGTKWKLSKESYNQIQVEYRNARQFIYNNSHKPFYEESVSQIKKGDFSYKENPIYTDEKFDPNLKNNLIAQEFAYMRQIGLEGQLETDAVAQSFGRGKGKESMYYPLGYAGVQDAMNELTDPNSGLSISARDNLVNQILSDITMRTITGDKKTPIKKGEDPYLRGKDYLYDPYTTELIIQQLADITGQYAEQIDYPEGSEIYVKANAMNTFYKETSYIRQQLDGELERKIFPRMLAQFSQGLEGMINNPNNENENSLHQIDKKFSNVEQAVQYLVDEATKLANPYLSISYQNKITQSLRPQNENQNQFPFTLDLGDGITSRDSDIFIIDSIYDDSVVRQGNN